MIYTITRQDSNYLQIPGRLPAVNVSDTNFAEVATFTDLLNHCNDATIGIEHNRRFFGVNNPYTEEFLTENLKTNKAIICPYFGTCTNIDLFKFSHNSDALGTALDLTCKEHPELATTINVLAASNFMSLHNMIFTTKEVFAEYVDFLKDTLFKYNLTDANDTKLNAHLAERYQTLFLLSRFKISELGFINVTCFSKDLTHVVNNSDGLDRT